MIANPFAKILIDVGAVKLSAHQPFKYASGLVGPIYCDNRMLLSHPKERKEIIFGLSELARRLPSFDQLAGLATAGIPHAAFMADILDAPMCYIRSKPKEHGRGNQVEGDLKTGQKLLLIEDLVNQGSSLKEAVDGARRQGLIVTDCLSIVTYQTKKSYEVCHDLEIKLHSLVTFDDLINTAFLAKQITDADILMLKEWHDDPKVWSVKWSHLTLSKN